jgi:hypothetical protein
MRRVMVRYRVKPEHVAENEALIRAVYAELEQTEPNGIRYATFKLDDGATFVHLLIEDDDVQAGLPGVNAFEEFRSGIRERCEELPVTTELDEIGSFHLG